MRSIDLKKKREQEGEEEGREQIPCDPSAASSIVHPL
jgi:hypothetical protein